MSFNSIRTFLVIAKKLLTERVSGMNFLYSSGRILFSTFVTNNYVIWQNYTLIRTL